MTNDAQRLQDALLECAALGDEAHYEQTSRHPHENPVANELIESFAFHRERAMLRVAFLSAYDDAASRQLVAESLFGPRSTWTEIRA
jgi:hypothetical protein